MLVRATIGSALLELTSPEEVQQALLLLYRVDLGMLEHWPGRWPRLYDSGIRYQWEPDPTANENRAETWLTLAELYDGRETADCEDIACARAAELTYEGTPAVPELINLGPGEWHIIVRYADGGTEDPSRILGMDRVIDLGRSEVSGRAARAVRGLVRPVGRAALGVASRVPVVGAALDVGRDLVESVRAELRPGEALEPDAIVDADGTVLMPLDTLDDLTDEEFAELESAAGAMWL